MGRISIDKSLIKDLTELLEENNLSEITIQQGRQSVKVARNSTSGATIVSQPNITQKDNKIEILSILLVVGVYRLVYPHVQMHQ